MRTILIHSQSRIEFKMSENYSVRIASDISLPTIMQIEK